MRLIWSRTDTEAARRDRDRFSLNRAERLREIAAHGAGCWQTWESRHVLGELTAEELATLRNARRRACCGRRSE